MKTQNDLFAWIFGIFLFSGCVDNPKVTRAAVTQPTEEPKVAASKPDLKKDRSSDTDDSTYNRTIEPDSSERPTGSVNPTGAANPSGSVNPTGSVDPEITVSPTATVDSLSADPGPARSVNLPPAGPEFEEKTKQCAAGNAAHLCIQVASRAQSQGNDEDALKYNLIACMGASFTAWGKAKCTYNDNPLISNANGCFGAAFLYRKKKDLKSEKSALQCACNKKFKPACEILKPK